MAHAFLSPRFDALLRHHGLTDLGAFWQLPWNWAEAPNQRRDGWSGAGRFVFADAQGREHALFVKRQENHCYRDWYSPWKKQPTFRREFNNALRLAGLGIPAIEPVFYDEVRVDGTWRAVLVTVALDGYTDLDSLFEHAPPTGATRDALLRRIADTVFELHANGLEHHCLSGKHFMVKLNASAQGEDGIADLRLLDLEKMKESGRSLGAAGSDVEKLLRHTQTLSPRDHTDLVRRYLSHWSAAKDRAHLLSTINERFVAKERQRGRDAEPITL